MPDVRLTLLFAVLGQPFYVAFIYTSLLKILSCSTSSGNRAAGRHCLPQPSYIVSAGIGYITCGITYFLLLARQQFAA